MISSVYTLFLYASGDPRDLHSFPTRRSSDLATTGCGGQSGASLMRPVTLTRFPSAGSSRTSSSQLFRTSQSSSTQVTRSEEHTSELQSRGHLVCRLLLEKKNKIVITTSQVNT